jgi:hypothetical protein
MLTIIEGTKRWRDVDVDGVMYLVSSAGEVRRAGSDRLLKPQLNDSGYLRVKVGRPSKRVWLVIHLTVLDLFVKPRPSPWHHGAHKDGNQRNNNVENLVWKLPIENEADKKAHGTWSNRRLDVEGVKKAREMAGQGLSIEGIARALGISYAAARRAVRQESWRDVA